VVSNSGGGSFVAGRLRSVSRTLKRGAAGAGVSADGGCCIEEDDAEARSLYLQVSSFGSSASSGCSVTLSS
jgi:hypothetical protein